MSASLNTLAKVLNQADRAPEGSPERESYMERAIVMSQAIGIDLAVARAHQADKEKVEKPERRQIKVGQYGSKSQTRLNHFLSTLFNAIAEPNDIEVTFGGTNVYVYAYGFPSDIDVTEKLFAALAVQMVAEADRLLKAGAHKYETTEREPVYEWTGNMIDDPNHHWYDWGEPKQVKEMVEVRDPITKEVKMRDVKKHYSKVDGRVWRSNFYDGFISRIRARLYEERRKEVARREEEAQTGTAVALRNKAQEVVDFYQEETKHMSLGVWTPPTSSGYSGDGVTRGQNVAAKANLGVETGVGNEERKAL